MTVENNWNPDTNQSGSVEFSELVSFLDAKGVDTKAYFNDGNPTDMDRDGLNDLEEIFLYRTNPIDPDTDNDTYNDFVEASSDEPILNPNVPMELFGYENIGQEGWIDNCDVFFLAMVHNNRYAEAFANLWINNLASAHPDENVIVLFEGAENSVAFDSIDEIGRTNNFNWDPIFLENVSLMGWDNMDLFFEEHKLINQLIQTTDQSTGEVILDQLYDISNERSQSLVDALNNNAQENNILVVLAGAGHYDPIVRNYLENGDLNYQVYESQIPEFYEEKMK